MNFLLHVIIKQHIYLISDRQKALDSYLLVIKKPPANIQKDYN